MFAYQRVKIVFRGEAIFGPCLNLILPTEGTYDEKNSLEPVFTRGLAHCSRMIARRILVVKLVEFQTQNIAQSLETLKNISRLASSIEKK